MAGGAAGGGEACFEAVEEGEGGEGDGGVEAGAVEGVGDEVGEGRGNRGGRGGGSRGRGSGGGGGRGGREELRAVEGVGNKACADLGGLFVSVVVVCMRVAACIPSRRTGPSRCRLSVTARGRRHRWHRPHRWPQ